MSRTVLVVTSARTSDKAQLVTHACEFMLSHGIEVRLDTHDFHEMQKLGLETPAPAHSENDEIEVALVIGGDGSILRAAEILRGTRVPILGVNAGHVGFMAQAEEDFIDQALQALIDRKYEVRDRLCLDVIVTSEGQETFRSWALNEVTVEKSARERMLEVVVEVNSRPVSSFGCDGVLVSTPTGSTAYAFSAGGPVIWPNVEAMIMIPLSAHALFARPMVVGPKTELAIEVLKRSSGTGVLWCDGRRTFDLGPGARVEVRQSEQSVPMVVLGDEPFSDRLVKKFSLPVTGWRGPDVSK